MNEALEKEAASLKRLRSSVGTQTNRELSAADRDRFFALTLDMLCISSSDGYFKWLNPSFAQTLGWSIEELLSKSYTEFVHPDDLTATIEEVTKQIVAGEKVFHFENRYRHKDGSWRVLSWKSVPEGELMYAVARDVTERTRMERELKNWNLELESRVSERTEALQASEAQFRQAQKMEAIGNLTGGMAHDFNNLLSVIIGNLDLVRGKAAIVDPEINELTSEALDAALRGADLTRRLLAFARRQPLQPKHVDVNVLIENIIVLVDRMLNQNIEIRLDLGTDTWPVFADPAQLEAALFNIINNARDAMPNGGKLTIATRNRNLDADYTSLHPGLEPGSYALIELSDTGTGMPPELLSKIFEPFFTTKEQGKGTGLGLSMVFGFMKQSSGHINVYSEMCHGTTFRLYLPRSSAAAEAYKPTETLGLKGHETVLAVEDNESLRRVVARQLNDLGYRVIEAQNGLMALRILESEQVDVLFTDIVMPGGMSGSDLAREAVLRWPHLKVLLTSGFAEDTLNGNGHTQVSSPVLTKPYRKDDLARALREVLGTG